MRGEEESKADKINKILELIGELNDEEHNEFRSRGAGILSRRIGDTVESKRAGFVLQPKQGGAARCPRCTSEIIKPYGFYRDRRRYRCLICRRTFNELTGSPITGTLVMS